MKSTTISIVLLLLIISNIGCIPDKKLPEAVLCELDCGQGQMCGEVTSSSVILQSRLTCGREFVDGDIPGREGVACFQISKNLAFKDNPQSRWVPADQEPVYDTKYKEARHFAENPNWQNYHQTPWVKVTSENDFIIKQKVENLKSGTRYHYRLLYGSDKNHIKVARTCTLKTHDSADVESKRSFVVVTGMNHYFFYYSYYNRTAAYEGSDRFLGFPALKTIVDMQPDFFLGTGDNVYYDHPVEDTVRAKTKAQLRAKWHEQFSLPRFQQLFAQVPTYWQKDDHDFRYNDSDSTTDRPPSAELGIRIFNEQVPIVDPTEINPVTYRTHRVNKLLQIWLVEGRDYRSPNKMPDGPDKTLWGKEQIKWLKKTLLESDAIFKILV
ncbi:MAG: alkaline phosphatase D family protein [Planctomycetota bacterium]|jgi:alkaline phosphatase/alkaline phosphatase D